MATTYSTPGVYVVEQSAFPPSVAQVPTAIPAFVGYTEKDTYSKTDDLNMSPTKISSLLEYNTLFGGAPESVISNVDLSIDNTVSSVTIAQPYYMYPALQMFYANGGGDCYIVSVGLYSSGTLDEAKLEAGIDTLEKKDEPSLLLFPDAVKLTEANFYKLQMKALAHCNKLQNRFCILDTFYPGDDDLAYSNSIDNHRTGLGVSNLNYGAVYTPWLQSDMAAAFTYIDFSSVITKLTISIPLLSLTSDPLVSPLITAYDVLISDGVKLNTAIGTFIGIGGPFTDLEKLNGNAATVLANFQKTETTFKLDAANPAPVLATIDTDYQNLINDVYNLAVLIDSFLAPAAVITADLKNAISSEITNNIAAAHGELANLIILNTTIASDANFIGANPAIPVAPALNNAALNTLLTTVVPADPTFFPNNAAGLTTQQQIQNMVATEAKYVAKAYFRLYTSLQNIIGSLDSALQSKENSLYSSFSVYKTIRDYLNNSAVTLMPPSGAVAGLYAYTDNNRGVWKAPANTSVSGVVSGSGVSIDITDDMQSGLNIDVTSGKSINAIRDFTGKGTLVWGARTLAGNDNDWRYVSVRRFCIMVEQSIKKSISWAVFETNDANTWAKVKGMIENFLTLQWRNGALQGAKPTDAFNVQVGLGTTMTGLDILEGRMIVQVKMAVVHPAEFIILTFTQMMATS